MATVTGPDGISFEETGPEALAYYAREDGFTVGGTAEVAASETADATVVDDKPQQPADSAHKQDWVAFALLVAPDDVDSINDAATTKQDLIDKYGG